MYDYQDLRFDPGFVSEVSIKIVHRLQWVGPFDEPTLNQFRHRCRQNMNWTQEVTDGVDVTEGRVRERGDFMFSVKGGHVLLPCLIKPISRCKHKNSKKTSTGRTPTYV